MKSKLAILLLAVALGLPVIASAEEKTKVKVEFKKYEKIDLGSLEVKGTIIAPGDLSVKERDRKEFDVNLFERSTFDREVKKDIYHLR
ncbi:MAG: hypothetical protein WCG27_05975 [Pseudomonadota bacterium]